MIELRSEQDRLPALREKMQMWIANGAELAWLIDPTTKTVEMYRPREALDMILDPSSVLGDGPVDEFEVVLNRVCAGE